MKKIGLYLCLGLASVALSCTKDIVDSPFGKEGVMELTFMAGIGQTRSSDPRDDEDKINSLQVFLFSADSLLESVGYSAVSDTVVLRCSKGDKIAYAVTNYDKIGWWEGMTVSDLMGTVVKLSEKNWNVMVGDYVISESALIPLDSFEEIFPVTSDIIKIGVKRIAARVVLIGIRNGSAYDTNGSTDIYFRHAYLTNVMGDAALSAAFSEDYSHEAEVWYNRCGNEGDLESLLYGDTIAGQLLRGGGEFGLVSEYLYCFPNPTKTDSTSSFVLGDDGVSSVWIPRYTRLVVEATYGGELTYYPISIKGIRSNCSYEVTLIITRKGSSDPEDNFGSAAPVGLSASCQFDFSSEDSDEEGSFIPIEGGYVQVRECCL
ncbi:MAG: hypothetical protein LUD72_02270 [Bacteroidales bacterium]|nr:hypothetical protein [Bacteroidales bacterium]